MLSARCITNHDFHLQTEIHESVTRTLYNHNQRMDQATKLKQCHVNRFSHSWLGAFKLFFLKNIFCNSFFGPDSACMPVFESRRRVDANFGGSMWTPGVSLSRICVRIPTRTSSTWWFKAERSRQTCSHIAWLWRYPLKHKGRESIILMPRGGVRRWKFRHTCSDIA